MDWDAQRVSVSEFRLPTSENDLNGEAEDRVESGPELDLTQVQARFRHFLRSFRSGEEFIYRDQLAANYAQEAYHLVLSMEDLESFDKGELLNLLVTQPAVYLPAFEKAAKEVSGIDSPGE